MKHLITLTALQLSSLAPIHAAGTFLIENGQPCAEILTAPTAGKAHIFLGKWHTYVLKLAGYVYARYHKDLDVLDYDDSGTLNVVYEFLRSLGVRWHTQGELGEVGPKSATIALPEVNRTVTPDFRITEKFAKLWGK